ncbi:MAG: hypothetical protein F4169_12475 [Gammaproteobacteria bacterium]|nr:hypothetical protein [Gammaproteobacteria bacterium]
MSAVEQGLLKIEQQTDKDKYIPAIHDVEADLCLLKPYPLLYPTWIRLRESLYRFDKQRGKAWAEDMARLLPADAESDPGEIPRQRLQLLTLELQESAARYNRLAEERAGVIQRVNILGVCIVTVGIVGLVISITFSTTALPPSNLFLSLLAAVLAGGIGAVISRLRTIKRERVRSEFSTTLMLDMASRVSLGATAALFVASVLLSGFLRLPVPDDPTALVTTLVTLGLASGVSDRLFSATLERVIGQRAPKPRTDGS